MCSPDWTERHYIDTFVLDTLILRLKEGKYSNSFVI